jgi:hypothetical protein
MTIDALRLLMLGFAIYKHKIIIMMAFFNSLYVHFAFLESVLIVSVSVKNRVIIFVIILYANFYGKYPVFFRRRLTFEYSEKLSNTADT